MVGKKLSELRVVELREELEKRGLDKNGIKTILIARLTEALEEEGNDPKTFIFEEEDEENDASQNKEEVKEKVSEEKNNESVDSKKEKPAKKLAENKKSNDESVISPTKKEDDDDLRLTLDDDETLHEDLNEPDVKTKEKPQENTEDKETNEEDDKKNKDETKKPLKTNPNIVWVSNVAKKTRAAELKQALLKEGKVVSAKIVVNARFPGSNCFGFVTMATPEDAEKVIEKLTNTELNGQIITIQKYDEVRLEQLNKAKQNIVKKEGTKPPGENKIHEKFTKEKEGEGFHKKPFERSPKGRGRGRGFAPSRRGGRPDRRSFPPRGGDSLTFSKIKEKVEFQKQRERERVLRDEARRRQEEEARQREIERRQKNEAARLEREKQKLIAEKEKIERERAELIRLEKERQRLEREKLAREKAELQSTLQRMEEDRRSVKRPHSYRDNEYSRKKLAPNDRQYEVPSSQRYNPYPRPKSPPPQKEYRNSSKGNYGSSGDYRSSSKGDYSSARPYQKESGSSSRKYEKSYEMPSRRSDNVPESRDKFSRYADKEIDRSPHYKSTPKDTYKPSSTSTPYGTTSKAYPSDHKPYSSSGGGTYSESRGNGNHWPTSNTPKAYISSNFSSNSKPWEKSATEWSTGNKYSSVNGPMGGPSMYSTSGTKSYTPDGRYVTTYGKSASGSYKKY